MMGKTFDQDSRSRPQPRWGMARVEKRKKALVGKVLDGKGEGIISQEVMCMVFGDKVKYKVVANVDWDASTGVWG